MICNVIIWHENYGVLCDSSIRQFITPVKNVDTVTQRKKTRHSAMVISVSDLV